MSWLQQNWIWIIVVIAIAWFLINRKGGAQSERMPGHGAGNLVGTIPPGNQSSEEPQQVLPRSAEPDAAIDPVSGQPVRTADALTSIYQGRIYYFSSKEDRERFEAAPQEYAHRTMGQPVHSAEPTNHRPRRHHGC